MSFVGDRLRRERLEHGLDLAEIAARTRIPAHYLKGIEDDDPEALPPGGFFYRSFVRQYVAALGIEDREVETELERMHDQEQPPVPGHEHRLEKPPKASLDKVSWAFTLNPTMRSIALLVAVVAACSAFYSWWNKATQQAKAPEVVAAVSRHPTRPAPTMKPNQAAATQAAPTSTASGTSAPATTAQAPDSADHLQLSLQATEATWLSVALDGKHAFSGILQPNEVKTVEGLEMARLLLGNAGGIQVRWNGREVGPFGGHGQVRTVVFTRDKYEVVPPKPPGDSGDGEATP